MTERANRALRLVDEYRVKQGPFPRELAERYDQLRQAVKHTETTDSYADPQQVSYLGWLTQRMVDVFEAWAGVPLVV